MIQFKENSLLRNIVDYTDGIESSKIFRIWCGIYTMAAHIGRRCFVSYGRLKIYPNFYIVLIGDSGITRKTTAAKLLLEDFGYETCPYPIFGGTLTKSRLITNLSKKAEENVVNLFISELSTLMTDDRQGRDIITTLTDLYDCHRQVLQDTQTRGLETALDPCVNMLGASTREWINTNMPPSFVEGGFSSRCIFVVYMGEFKPISKPILTDFQKLVSEKLMEQFQRLKNLKGEFPVSKDADVFIDTWYKNMWRESKSFHPRLVPYHSRKQLHMLKVALIIAISEGVYEISLAHIKQAHDLLHITEENMEYAFEGIGDFRAARLYDRIQRLVSQNHGSMFYAEIVSNVASLGTRLDIKEALALLVDSEKLTVESIGGKALYKTPKRKRKVSGV